MGEQIKTLFVSIAKSQSSLCHRKDQKDDEKFHQKIQPAEISKQSYDLIGKIKVYQEMNWSIPFQNLIKSFMFQYDQTFFTQRFYMIFFLCKTH